MSLLSYNSFKRKSITRHFSSLGLSFIVFFEYTEESKEFRNVLVLIFDFDGVLIDSLPAMQVAWLSVQKEFGIKAEFKQYKEFIGLPFNIILSKLNIDPPLHNSIYQHYSKIASRNKNLINLNPYVEFILSWLSKNSISTGIVTSKDKLRTYELIEYFQLFRIFSIAYLFMTIYYPIKNILLGIEKASSFLLGSIVSVLSMILAGPYLVVNFGLIGAIFTFTISRFLQTSS